MHKHWIKFFNAQGHEYACIHTDCRIALRHMIDHARGLARTRRHQKAHYFQIVKETGSGKANLEPLTEIIQIRS